jgi:glycosyltransferase involved in cell wall biosynthesis
MPKPLRLLHLPTAALPWVVGGRETYSRSLADNLQALGWENHLAFHQNPEHGEPIGTHPTDTGPRVHVLPGLGPIPREAVYRVRTAVTPGFGELLDALRPEVMHLHDFSTAVNLSHLEQARARGIKTVMTYHTPGQSCKQYELLYNGQTVCDGEIRIDRCTACRLGVQGIPSWIRWPLAKVPLPLAGSGKLGRALSARRMTVYFQQAWREMVGLVDRVHVYADWVRELMARNGVPPEKIRFFRTGLPMTPTQAAPRTPRKPGEVLRLVMVGRCDRTKGQAVLIEAVKGLPQKVAVQVEFIGPYWDATEYGRGCLQAIAGDARFLPPRKVPHAEIPGVLAKADALVVPSLWLETGPLVVLEAFASGVPVVGSRLGGIAELVRHERDGLLFEPNSAEQLRAAILRLASDAGLHERLRQGIEPPRTMRQVAADADAMYREMLVDRAI